MLSSQCQEEGKLSVCEGPEVDRRSLQVVIQWQDGLASYDLATVPVHATEGPLTARIQRQELCALAFLRAWQSFE